MAKSFKERLHKGYEQTLEISGKPLADEKTKFQRVKIFDTPSNGRVMTLDNIVQITTRDESAYAEMLSHLPMFEHGKVERIILSRPAVEAGERLGFLPGDMKEKIDP